ncbi:twin-arginine translocase subunit TatA, partial [Aeromonas veronii]|nr:twin-arginine translocase subunit TatA [Aeromonas veronii]
LSDEPADAKAEQKDAEFPPKQLNEAATQSSETAKQKDKDQA